MSEELDSLSPRNSLRITPRSASEGISRPGTHNVRAIQSESNPLAHTSSADEVETIVIRVENLSNARQIQEHELQGIIEKLMEIEENNALLLELDEAKTPYLFTSENLLRLIDVTTSIRTQLTIISMIGPRLVDPRAKTSELLNLFRFAEEKAKVEEVLKARATALAVTIFKNSPATTPVGGRGAGRGGRGGLALPGRRSTETSAKPETPGSEATGADGPPRSEVSAPSTPMTPAANNSDGTPTAEEGGALSLLQRPSRGITFVDKHKSSFALKKPATEPVSATKSRLSTDSKPASNTGTPLMRSATNSRRPSNTGDGVENVTKGISSMLGEEAKSYTSLDGYDTPPRTNAARSGSHTPVTGGEDYSMPKSRYAKEETLNNRTVEIIPSSFGVENLKRAFLRNSIEKEKDAIQSLCSTPRSARTFKPPSPITVPAQKVSESGIVDAISKIASAVGLDAKAFLSLEPEQPLEVREDGFPFYTYRELVRQSHRKDFASGVVSSELEAHLKDDEFERVFGMTRAQFNETAKWRRISQKKTLFLF